MNKPRIDDPHPPAAGAAAGERGIDDPTASEVGFLEGFRKRLTLL
jgi:hypothetical protein